MDDRRPKPGIGGFQARVLAALLVFILIAVAGIISGLLGREERNDRLEAFSRTWEVSEEVDLLRDDLDYLHRQFTLLSQGLLDDNISEPVPASVRDEINSMVAIVSERNRRLRAFDVPWMTPMLTELSVLLEDWKFVLANLSVDFVGATTRLVTEAAPRAELLLETSINDVHQRANSQLMDNQASVARIGNKADRTLFLGLIVPLLFFAWISALLVRRVIGSLNIISGGIGYYASGDFSHRVTIQGTDEFADAAAQINIMADQRKQALDSLSQMNATLEIRVQERTAELSASRERLAEAQRIARIGSWELDLTRNHLSWSEEVFRIFELDSDAFGASYEAFLDAIHPDDRAVVNQAYTRSLETRTPYQIIHRLMMPDGRIKHVEERCETEFDAGGKPLVSHGTIQEITEKVRAEESLREKDIINRQVINTSLDAVIIINEEGAIVDWNKQAEIIFKWPRQEVLGLKLSETIIPHKYRDAHTAGMKKYLSTGEGPVLNQRLELTALDRTGHEFPIELAISPMKIGDRSAFSAFVRDLTPRKEGEAERERLQSELTQAQKMEAIGRLAGGVAHDFNNMLSVILGYTDMAMAKLKGDERFGRDLKEIRNAAERASGITRQLLAFARKQTVAPKLIDLNITIDGMLGMLRRLIGESVELAWAPNAQPLHVLIDPSQVDQLLVNLCVNARDSIEHNGRISIEADVAFFSTEDAADRTDIQAGSYVVLSVSDNGCGMDKETVRVIFEPFFTTKGKGTGLGLPTVYGIVRQNKGFINVYSEPGIGTTFSLYLPRAAVKEEALVKTTGLAANASQGAETIMVVEDESSILNMIEQMLQSLGYTVLTADVPSSAIALAKEHTGKIHLLLSDVIMPEMNGREMAQKIIAARPGMKVLFMSGYTSDFINKQGVIEEGVHFIQKPFSPTDLAQKIRQLF